MPYKETVPLPRIFKRGQSSLKEDQIRIVPGGPIFLDFLDPSFPFEVQNLQKSVRFIGSTPFHIACFSFNNEESFISLSLLPVLSLYLSFSLFLSPSPSPPLSLSLSHIDSLNSLLSFPK